MDIIHYIYAFKYLYVYMYNKLENEEKGKYEWYKVPSILLN